MAASVSDDTTLTKDNLKAKFLYKFGLFYGLIPLTVGLFIFFTWWIARAFYAIDLNNFEGYGLIWLIICVPFATVGLIIMTIFLFRNYPAHFRRSILGLIVILINIPTAYWVLGKQADIDKRAYIKIYNKTKQDNLELTLKASSFEKRLGTLSDTESLVDYYFPKYIYELGNDSYPNIDSVTLIIKEKSRTHYLKLPPFDKGQCEQLYLDKEFKLLDKWK